MLSLWRIKMNIIRHCLLIEFKDRSPANRIHWQFLLLWPWPWPNACRHCEGVPKHQKRSVYMSRLSTVRTLQAETRDRWLCPVAACIPVSWGCKVCGWSTSKTDEEDRESLPADTGCPLSLAYYLQTPAAESSQLRRVALVC